MRWIPAGRCVTMPVWFTVCTAGYYLEAPAAQIVMPSNGGGEALQALSPVKHKDSLHLLTFISFQTRVDFFFVQWNTK